MDDPRTDGGALGREWRAPLARPFEYRVPGPAALPEHPRLTDVAEALVVGALTKHARGERITWDVALDLMPTATGATPVVLVYLHIPSAVLGQLHGEMVVLDPGMVTLSAVDAQLSVAVEKLRRKRSAALSSS